MNPPSIEQSCVAIFGGTFDPFTIAHREICRVAIDRLPIDMLYVIPTVVDYHREGKERWLRDGGRVMFAHRMLWTLGHEYLEGWKIDNHEVKLKTICELTDERKGSNLCEAIVAKRRFLHTLLDFKCRTDMFTQIILILGADSLKNLPTWYKWREVCANINAIAVVNGRDGEMVEVPKEVEAAVPEIINLKLPDAELLNVSASNVREQFRDKGLEPYYESVMEYDRGHKEKDKCKTRN